MMKLGIMILFGLIFFTIIAGLVSSQKKVRQYFEMPAYVGVVPEHVQSAILSKIPLGSSRRKVQDFLSSRGIGQDGISSCEAKSPETRITCRVGFQHHFWQPIRETCTFSFDFDADHKLRNIEVQSQFAGL